MAETETTETAEETVGHKSRAHRNGAMGAETANGSGKKEGPMWLRVLREFGFPTLVALALMYAFWTYSQQMRQDMREERAAFVAALEKNTAAVERVGTNVEDMGRNVERLLGRHMADDHAEEARHPR